MKQRNRTIAIVILGIALAVAVVIVAGIPWGYRASAPAQKLAGAKPGTAPAASSTHALAAKTYVPHPPHGSVTYQVAQAATQLPAFVQATIDPADVAVGQVQHFMIVTNDPNPVTSVVAVITTDHKTITVPLVSQGVPAVSMLVPRTVYVTSDNTLALVTPGVGSPDIAETRQGAHIANAADSNDTEFTGQWTVEDTHTAKYQTVFIAKDSAGNENSVTLQWTDPCPFAADDPYSAMPIDNYHGGTATISGSCTMESYAQTGLSSVDGPENGNLVVSGPGVFLDIESGATLVMNSGYSISFAGGGGILIRSGGQILLGEDMCGQDNDGDGYIAGTGWTAAVNCGALASRVNVISTYYTNFDDCDDSDARVYPGSNYWETSPSNGGTWDYNCDGIIEEQYGPNGPGGFTGNESNLGPNCSGDFYCQFGMQQDVGWEYGDPGCGNVGEIENCEPINESQCGGGGSDVTQACQ
jgi:hypothetical protein